MVAVALFGAAMAAYALPADAASRICRQLQAQLEREEKDRVRVLGEQYRNAPNTVSEIISSSGPKKYSPKLPRNGAQTRIFFCEQQHISDPPRGIA